MKTTINFKKMLMVLMIAVGSEAKSQADVQPKINTYDFKNAIGLRAGETSGLTFKHKFNNGNAFEGIVSFWPYTVGVTGLYEKNMPTGIAGLNWYFGGGGHVNAGSMYRRYYLYNNARDKNVYYVERRDVVAVGVDGILGVEYKFKPVPFAVSADIKPFIETNNYGYTFLTLDPSVGIKFTF